MELSAKGIFAVAGKSGRNFLLLAKLFLPLLREDNHVGSMKAEYLDFITFCVGSLSDALDKSAAQVFNALRSSGVLADYIIPCYDVLHTFNKDYLVEELTEVLKERGALS